MLVDVKDADRVAAVQGEWAKAKASALGAERLHLPALGLAAPQIADHAAGIVPWQGGVVLDLQPQFRDAPAIDNLKLLFGELSDLAAACAGDAAQADGAQTIPRPGIAKD